MTTYRAVQQRQAMIANYKAMLETETAADRIEEIYKQIALCNQEIDHIKTGKPLFGKKEPLKQTTTFIEPDPKNKGEQKVTVINAPPKVTEASKDLATTTTNSNDKVVGNSLRNKLQTLKAKSAEDSLKAQVAAAKAKNNK